MTFIYVAFVFNLLQLVLLTFVSNSMFSINRVFQRKERYLKRYKRKLRHSIPSLTIDSLYNFESA